MKSADELKAVCLGAIFSCSLSTAVVALTVVAALLLAGCVTGAGYSSGCEGRTGKWDAKKKTWVGAAPGCEFHPP
jgi:hypothetical protein